MLIRCQNKKEIINLDNVININITDCEEDGYLISAGFIVGRDDNYIELGYYDTEERAKEILNEIAIAYCNSEMIKLPKINIKQEIPASELIRNICYKMPKE